MEKSKDKKIVSNYLDYTPKQIKKILEKLEEIKWKEKN